jgi:DHA1 family bicyclomycin/chloramphenicol resistance-like MFS transporter
MNKNSRSWETPPTALLAALAGMTALSIDINVPAMKKLEEVFHADAAQVQPTLYAFLAGYAIGQLVCGPISDRKGRRPVLLVGLFIFTLAGFACTFSQTLSQLIFFRLVQGLSASVGLTLARAMVRDKYNREEAAGVLSQITQMMILAPVVAPILGAALLVIGWRAVFLALGVIGAILWALCALRLPETLAHTPGPDDPKQNVLQNFWTVLRHRGSFSFILAVGFSYCGLFGYIGGSHIVFMGLFHLDEMRFSEVFAATAFCLMIGATVNRRLLPRHGAFKLLRVGALVLVAAGAALMLAAWLHPSIPTIMVPCMAYLFGLGMVAPNATALAMAPHGRLAGVVASLAGFLQSAGGAVAMQCAARFFDGHTPKSLAAVVATVATLTMLSVLVAGWRAPEETR